MAELALWFIFLLSFMRSLWCSDRLLRGRYSNLDEAMFDSKILSSFRYSSGRQL